MSYSDWGWWNKLCVKAAKYLKVCSTSFLELCTGHFYWCWWEMLLQFFPCVISLHCICCFAICPVTLNPQITTTKFPSSKTSSFLLFSLLGGSRPTLDLGAGSKHFFCCSDLCFFCCKGLCFILCCRDVSIFVVAVFAFCFLF